MARATWYQLEDGSLVDPGDCFDQKGVLTHKDGVRVKMKFADCPLSRGVDIDDATGDLVGARPRGKAKDVKPADQGKGYKTRESKAD